MEWDERRYLRYDLQSVTQGGFPAHANGCQFFGVRQYIKCLEQINKNSLINKKKNLIHVLLTPSFSDVLGVKIVRESKLKRASSPSASGPRSLMLPSVHGDREMNWTNRLHTCAHTCPRKQASNLSADRHTDRRLTSQTCQIKRITVALRLRVSRWLREICEKQR